MAAANSVSQYNQWNNSTTQVRLIKSRIECETGHLPSLACKNASVPLTSITCKWKCTFITIQYTYLVLTVLACNKCYKTWWILPEVYASAFIKIFLQLSPLNILPYQYPPQSVGSLGHSTIGSAGLSPTQSISSTSSQSNISSASPDVISTPESPATLIVPNSICSSTNSVVSGSHNNNYNFPQHLPMDIAARWIKLSQQSSWL